MLKMKYSQAQNTPKEKTNCCNCNSDNTPDVGKYYLLSQGDLHFKIQEYDIPEANELDKIGGQQNEVIDQRDSCACRKTLDEMCNMKRQKVANFVGRGDSVATFLLKSYAFFHGHSFSQRFLFS